MMFLTEDEVRELTGRKRHSAQVRALCTMGITHRVRPDGRPMVVRSHVEDPATGSPPTQLAATQPNWDALNEPAQT